jgi:Mce-associated membrane protein
MELTSARRGGRMTRRGASPPPVPTWEDGVVDDDVDLSAGAPTEAGPPVREDREEDEQATTVLPAADETGPAEDSSEVEPAESEPLLRGRGLTGMVALLVVTVLLLAAAITAGVFWANGAAEQADRENALSAARQTAVNLTTIDFNRAEEDVRRVLDGSTGDFGGLFTQNIDSYVGVVKDGEVVTTGEVAEAGVEKYDGNTASAVVAVKTTVKNKTVPNGEQRFYRLVEQMEKHDGRWLVSRVEFVP